MASCKNLGNGVVWYLKGESESGARPLGQASISCSSRLFLYRSLFLQLHSFSCWLRGHTVITGRDVKDAEDDASEEDHPDSQANLSPAERESNIVEALPEVAAGSRKPAWEDPDEAELHINIAATSRLRKLRASEAETTISGKP